MTTRRLSAADVERAGIPDWRLLVRALHTRFETGDWATGQALLERIGAAAEEANHHPDVRLGYGHLDVALMSHDAGAVTERDLAMARTISALATEAGVVARPEQVARIEIALDTADAPAAARFWSAVLGIESDSSDEVADLAEQLPTLWFQDTDAHAEPRQRFHLDLWVPPELAQQRIDAALAAGGSLVSDSEAPSFWVLADPEGNKVCICTSQDRD